MMTSGIRKDQEICWRSSLCRNRLCLFVLCALVTGILYGLSYLALYTAVPLYVLDRLSLRTYFMPDISCNQCNNFTYEYIIDNRNFCTGNDVYLLIMVVSFHVHAKARTAIRSTWGGVKEYRGRRIKTLFVFGFHTDKNMNGQLEYEQRLHGDVMQARFDEGYKTLTNKSMAGLRWVREFCPQAEYVLKTDDDSFNLPHRYIDYLLHVQLQLQPCFIGGYCFTVLPDRRTGSKFYTPLHMYPDGYYPTYCSGPGYVMSRQTVKEIVRVASDGIYLTMEDVFVSGVCRVLAGIQYTQITGIVEGHHRMTKCALATWFKNAHNVVPEKALQLWPLVQEAERERDCSTRNAFLSFVLIACVILWLRFVYSLIKKR